MRRSTGRSCGGKLVPSSATNLAGMQEEVTPREWHRRRRRRRGLFGLEAASLEGPAGTAIFLCCLLSYALVLFLVPLTGRHHHPR